MTGGDLFAYRSPWSAVQHVVNNELMRRHGFRTSASFTNVSILFIILSLSGTRSPTNAEVVALFRGGIAAFAGGQWGTLISAGDKARLVMLMHQLEASTWLKT